MQTSGGSWDPWTPGGKLLQQDETYHVYETAADGTDRVDLLGSDEIALAPTSCGSDDVVVLTRILDGHKASVWRLNVVTGEIKRLTFGSADQLSSCTPDGKWVVYQGLLATDSVSHILKVLMDGGAPVELARGDVLAPAVSPDGKLVVFMRGDGQGGSKKRKWVVQKLESGTLVREFPVAAATNDEGWETDEGWKTLGWTPDGRAFTYVGNTTGNTQNVYMQPLNGGPAVQLTHFNSEPAAVVGYGWSRDGKKFAITDRGFDSATGFCRSLTAPLLSSDTATYEHRTLSNRISSRVPSPTAGSMMTRDQALSAT